MALLDSCAADGRPPVAGAAAGDAVSADVADSSRTVSTRKLQQAGAIASAIFSGVLAELMPQISGILRAGSNPQIRSAAFQGYALSVRAVASPPWCLLFWNFGKPECDTAISQVFVDPEGNTGWTLNDRARMWTRSDKSPADNVCLTGWDMQSGTPDQVEYLVYAARCGNGWDSGLVQSIFLTPDPENRISTFFNTPLFRIHVESKGDRYCLAATGPDRPARFEKCIVSPKSDLGGFPTYRTPMSQLWFIPHSASVAGRQGAAGGSNLIGQCGGM
ncbi:hypothetical protein PLESTB_000799000 [Pleodorina starrii]|uniref:Uncharacterized protein n=1 Tax=Pleodorina starrii TaxID=330485 RepID=A0A9W6BL34_9CHLO|nr:hypothetical protein PLESTB_000799000 [Pleodorina starrii]